MNPLIEKEVYTLIHDTNAGLGSIQNAIYYLKKQIDLNKEKDVNVLSIQVAIEYLNTAKKKTQSAVDEYYKYLKEKT